MLVYIAGPITAKDGFTQEDNIAAACEAFLRLSRAGVVAFCPHLTALAPGAFDVPYDHWLKADLTILERCDAVLMLPRWETSNGARVEHAMAVELDKRIYYDEKELT